MVKIQNVWETKYTSSEIKEKSLQRKETSVVKNLCGGWPNQDKLYFAMGFLKNEILEILEVWRLICHK